MGYETQVSYKNKVVANSERNQDRKRYSTINYLYDYYLTALNFSSERAVHRVQRITALGNQLNTLVTTQH